MLVDPLLLVVLVALLVAASGLAAVFYWRYRAARAAYNPYAPQAAASDFAYAPTPPASEQPSAAELPEGRYITGADFAVASAVSVSAPVCAPLLHADAPADPAHVSLGVSTAGSPAGDGTVPAAEKRAAPASTSQAAPADLLFYEFTPGGFVPVNPHLAPPPSVGETPAATTAVPAPPEPAWSHQPLAAADPDAREDGFVWL